ncbi:MAG: antibiotic biosynthesis monooxygenase [Roseateles depolymerans]|uniref:Antibiotic biosynthesis monooxygenase n=1 Tax=Roseateles depolymerans TaxID=76731 RepID=A0A2W5DC33_9BURK|nr:MAG: antibiotic biosynthesis monooxygenase [Roseateles depolymerans]
MSTSASSPVAVVATLTVLPGQRDAVLAALREAVVAVRGEPGCESYVLHEDSARPERLVMIERWSSAAALEQHAQAPAFTALAARLQGRAELQVLTLKPLF